MLPFEPSGKYLSRQSCITDLWCITERAHTAWHMMLRGHDNTLSGGIARESVRFKYNESEIAPKCSCEQLLHHSLDCMQGVASKYTVGFLLPTTTRKPSPFFISFVFLYMQYGGFFAEKQDFTFKMLFFFFFCCWLLVGTPKIHTGNTTRKGKIRSFKC